MQKLSLIIQREFIAKVRNKSFIIMTCLSPVLLVGTIALVTYLTKSSIEKKSSVAYVDESGYFGSEEFEDNETLSFEDLSEVGLEKAKIIVEESGHEGLLYIPPEKDLDKLGDRVQFFSEESPSMITISALEAHCTA